MIIRILGDAQYDVPEADMDRLNELDTDLQRTVDGADEIAFGAALRRLLAEVRAVGDPVPETVLTPSVLVLPGEESGLAEVAALVREDGLIPG